MILPVIRRRSSVKPKKNHHENQTHIYVGSASHNFYTLNPDGTERWHMQTGEIVDSAGALLSGNAETGPRVVFPSGDGHLYCWHTLDGTQK